MENPENIVFAREHIQKAKDVYVLIKANHKKNKVPSNKYSLKPKCSLYCNLQVYSSKTEEGKLFWKGVQMYILKNK